MSLRLACDLDGVLADMESALVREAKKLFDVDGPAEGASVQAPSDESYPPAESNHDAEAITGEVAIPPTMRLTGRQERQLWRHVASIEGFWESLDEIEPGSVARLAALARDCRWEVLFLTKRPEAAGLTAQVQSQRWLEAHGYALPSVFVLTGSRGRVATALGLDVVVDDRPENCVDVVVDSHARAMLVWRRDLDDVPEAAKCNGIDIVTSFDEGLDRLRKRGPGAPRGLVDRMIGRLGFKGPSRS